MRITPMLLASFFLAAPAQAGPTEHPPAPLRAVAENAPAIMIAAHIATRMKRDLDNYALFIDVDAAANTASTVHVDAHVPLNVYDAPETYDAGFLGKLDEARRAKGLRFDDGVVVVSRSARTALEASELMREHGYTLVFAVTTP